MEYDEAEVKKFLMELYSQTGGELDRQVGRDDVGAAIGLEKGVAGAMAEDLIMDGLVELKTLSGAIGITAKGIEQLQQEGLTTPSAEPSRRISGNVVLTAEDLDVVSEILAEIRKALGGVGKGYEECEEAVVDIKTIEVQLLSARPKTEIVLAVFSSLRDVLVKLDLERPAATLSTILEERR